MNTIWKKIITGTIYCSLVLPLTAKEMKDDSLVDVAKKNGNFKTLLAAVKAAGLEETLADKGPFTILAPTDQAFAALPDGTVDELLKPENKDALKEVLLLHVINGKISAREVAPMTSAKSLNGNLLSIEFDTGRLKINGAAVVANDVQARNGVIHVIDTVILPPTPQTENEKMQALIKQALKTGVPLFNDGNAEACAAIYGLCAQALKDFGDDQLGTELVADISTVLAEVEADSTSSEKNAWMLRNVLNRAYHQLMNKDPNKAEQKVTSMLLNENPEFKVKIESGLPEGFPEPGPVGRIVVKTYPEYRVAEVAGANMQNVAFMRLFSHIQSNDIPMTAPVEMKIDGDNARQQSMAFLYGKTSVGKVGRTESGVMVKDKKAGTYVSLGLSGSESSAKIKEAVSVLRDWFEANPQYAEGGEPRLLAYNSPMVPNNKRYWEIQIPVTDK